MSPYRQKILHNYDTITFSSCTLYDIDMENGTMHYVRY